MSKVTSIGRGSAGPELCADRDNADPPSMSQPTSSSAPPSPKMSVETAYVALDTAQLYTKTWLPAVAPVALLLFIHGFSEHIDRYDHVFSNFAERGIKTFAWDQRGFGRSAVNQADWGKTGGTEKALQDIDYFVSKSKEEARQKHIPLFLFGHSMGGALALMYAAQGPNKDAFRGVVSHAPLVKLVNPPSRVVIFLSSFVHKLLPNFKIYNPLPGSYMSRDPEMEKRYNEDPLVHGTGTLHGIYTMLIEGENLLQNPPVIAAPLLIQSGTQDKLTDFGAVRELYAKLPAGNPDREFKAWDGYYHELHNEPEEQRNLVIKYIADWILARVDDSTAPKAKL